MRLLPLFALLPVVALCADPRGDNPDAAPQTPEQERAQFHLPPGFEIQLVAAEPEIQKPININFDAAGRLWVTGSELYPWPASTDAAGNPIPDFAKAYDEIASAFRAKAPPASPNARDTVRILSDFGPDGRARKVEIFADHLNIPSGVQPLPRAPGAKGDTAIVYSIPYIWRLEDRDGDGRAEHREVLYGPFGYLDTHGGSSSYIYWMDGWIYGTHGFRNHSEVRDKNGKVLTLDSGNTYRFKPDGTAFEYYTHGQTNPFGLAFDPLGNLYSADSHSKPVYMLLRGGYYEGIGKQHDGLGFAPRITDDDHGSSAIAGIAYYADDKFPEEYRGNLFNGNPVTRRVNRDKLEWHGSTPKAIRQEDFLTSDDQWFRPVQVKLGPDGALYIADFYNAIIGHYEFPLADPRRDHTHGRIWRIIYRGEKNAVPARLPNLPGMRAAQVVDQLKSANLETRRLAANELADHFRAGALKPLSVIMKMVSDPFFTSVDFSPEADPKDVEKYFAKQEKARLKSDPTVTAAYAAWQRLLPFIASEPEAVRNELNTISIFTSSALMRDYPQLSAGMARAEASQMRNRDVSYTPYFASSLIDNYSTPAGQSVAAEGISIAAAEWLTPSPKADLESSISMLSPEKREMFLATRRDDERKDIAKALRPLLICWDYTPPEDTELIHSVRMALRDCLLVKGAYETAAELARINPQAAEHLAEVSLGAATPEAAAFLLDRLGKGQLTSIRAGDYVRHIALNLPEVRITELSDLLKNTPTLTEAQRLPLVEGFADGARKRNLTLAKETTTWLESTILTSLASPDHEVLKRALTAARDLKTDAKRAPLSAIITDAGRPRELRIAALEAVANVSLSEVTIAAALHDHTDLVLRRKAADVLGQIGSPDARTALTEALPSAPSELASSIAGALVQREAGARALVESVAAGKASPTLLRNKLVAMKIERVAPDLMPRLGELTANLPSEDARLDRAIAGRVESFERARQKHALNLTHGAQLFKTNCAVCHKFRNEGGNVGPNLDGVAARGLQRLVEDILDPNRNVDPAFRQVVIETTEGHTLAGVNAREEGANLLLSDATGATLTVAKAQIKSRTQSPLSLMPPAFEQTLSPDDLNDLIAFLISPAK